MPSDEAPHSDLSNGLFAGFEAVPRSLPPLSEVFHVTLSFSASLCHLIQHPEASHWHRMGDRRVRVPNNGRTAGPREPGRSRGPSPGTAPATHIRAGSLVPVLREHVSTHIGLHVYDGSRAAQPKRVRSLLDLAIQRLQDSDEFLLSDRELASAARRRKKEIGTS